MSKIGKRSKRPNKTPSRARYWATRQLERRKVRNMVRSNGLNYQEALKKWREQRKTRIAFDIRGEYV
ncbi:MAG TPA: hypothetical protein ENI52_03985 [Thermoplasmata archaeon]|nr:hypothetical protein [Thermoplasmata archaeon]